MIISETKLYDSFQTKQLLINGFNEPIRQDRNENSGRILLHIRDEIPTKVLPFQTLPFYVETNLNSKWPLQS